MAKSLNNLDSMEKDLVVALMNLMAVERRCADGQLGEMVRQIRAELLVSESRRVEVEAMAQELLAISDALNQTECTFSVDSNDKKMIKSCKERKNIETSAD